MTTYQANLIVYIDMDDTLCNYKQGFATNYQKHTGNPFPQSVPGFYLALEPLPDAVETYQWLSQQPPFDVYILTAPSLKNPHSYSEKRLWVEKHLGFEAVKKLIISPHKHLSKGAYLIDDCHRGKGQDRFVGQLIHYGSQGFPNWSSVRAYFERLLDQKIVHSREETPLPQVLCFRSFDMRDHFPEPVATFREALMLLQSDRAYLPEIDANIVCYLRSGQSIAIPAAFYLSKTPCFPSREEAEIWVKERAEDADLHGHPVFGLTIADPDLPMDEQIEQAFSYYEVGVIDPSENDRVCAEVDGWLAAAIQALPTAEAKATLAEGHTVASSGGASGMKPDLTVDPLVNQTDVAAFTAMFEQTCGSARWFIASDDAHAEVPAVTCYLDVANNVWSVSVNEATGFKQYHLAQVVCENLNPALKARVKQFLVSTAERAKTAIPIDIDRQVIAHHEPTNTTLYDTQGMAGLFTPNAVLHVQQPPHYTLNKSECSGDEIMVGIHPDAMDDLAIAWCRHRKLQGALGGPVGKEWGSPECEYD